jgi:hypothetical protein
MSPFSRGDHFIQHDRSATRDARMTYLHCPRCRLAIRCRAHYLTLTNCPRCLARAGIVSPLFASPLDAHELHAGEELPPTRAANRARSAGLGEELPAIRAANRSRSAGAAAEPRRRRS